MQLDARTRQGAEDPPNERGSRSSSPGEAELQFLGTSGQGQCGSQQADRGEDAAEICDTSPQSPLRSHLHSEKMKDVVTFA